MKKKSDYISTGEESVAMYILLDTSNKNVFSIPEFEHSMFSKFSSVYL